MAATSSDIQQTIDNLKRQLVAVDRELNSSFAYDLQNLPKVNYLIEWNKYGNGGVPFIRKQGNSIYMMLGKIYLSKTEGANGINRWLSYVYRHYNEMYYLKGDNRFKKVNDNWLGNKDVSFRNIRKCREFFLTAKQRFQPVLKELVERKKQIIKEINELEKTLGVLSTTSEHTRDIAENESEIAQFKEEIKEAQAEITARNLAIYGLPLIGLVVLGYFIYKRKI